MRENKTNLTSKKPFFTETGRGPEQQLLQPTDQYHNPLPTLQNHAGEHIPPKPCQERENRQKTINVSTAINISIENTLENFKAGKTADKINIWETITSDRWILNTIRGCNIELLQIPTQTFVPKPLNFSVEEREKSVQSLTDFYHVE